MERIKIQHHSFPSMIWVVGWLFSIGFLHLTFWKGVLALFIWPYYIGQMVATLMHR